MANRETRWGEKKPSYAGIFFVTYFYRTGGTAVPLPLSSDQIFLKNIIFSTANLLGNLWPDLDFKYIFENLAIDLWILDIAFVLRNKYSAHETYFANYKLKRNPFTSFKLVQNVLRAKRLRISDKTTQSRCCIVV